jgi:hypothetical protein
LFWIVLNFTSNNKETFIPWQGAFLGVSFDWIDDYPGEEEGYPTDEYAEEAEEAIEEIVSAQRVVTERELKVRLEHRFFPWVTGRALLSLVNEGRIIVQGLPGRRRLRELRRFFTLPDFKYEEIVGEMMEKKQVSAEVNAMLTGHAPATYYAEDLFERAFIGLGFDIRARDASEYNGWRVMGTMGKEPPNLDFILARDKVTYGVDVKNWIRYEYDTRNEVRFKVDLALQLHIVPFIIARYVDKETIYREIYLRGGICYLFKTLIFSPTFSSLSQRANQILGYPTIAMDRLPTYKVERIDFLHRKYLERNKS